MKHIVAAKVLIVDEKGEVLVLRNSSTHPRWPLCNDLPGGTVEEGETVEEAVVRETEEETSIKLEMRSVKLLYASTHVKKDAFVVYHLFLTRLEARPEIKISWEHDKYWWTPLSEAKEIEPAYQQGIDLLKANKLLS